MKTLLYIIALSSMLFATTGNTDLDSCKKCHPTIAQEFESSMHKKSSIYDDKVHKAVWDKHPAKAKGNYKCAKCHTPGAKTKEQSHAGITCVSCHTITSVEKHTKSNKNIYTDKQKTFYSAEKGKENVKLVYKKTTSWWGNKTTIGSAYHDIDYTNKDFYNGNICMGCHSHKQNSHKFAVCTTDDKSVTADKTKDNCITCHMPKIDGSATTVRISKQHTFHGFAGSVVRPDMLKKYVELEFKQGSNGFEISVENKAPHNFMTHPLRVVQLRATILRGQKHIALKTETFVKIIGTNGKASMPWLATEVVKDTMLKANETRTIKYTDALQSGDVLEVKFGYYIVNQKALKKLDLDGEEELKQFTVLKSHDFNVK